ncbi:MAG TPA: hypothetical protein VK926_02730 [Gaiellaceae bacterium]|nr:hypothetical protein [Gaiellaceae bacterium]
MNRAVLLVAAVGLLGLGGAAGWLLARETEEDETITQTTTATVTTTEVTPETSLPAAVDETRATLLAAAESADYEALRPFLSPAFSYTFGGPVEGGPIAYWGELERTTDERPLERLAAILKMPYVLTRGVYAWPWAYTVEGERDLSAHERELLAPLGDPAALFAGGSGYLGWRAGIEPDGTWLFFLAGD